jgi:4-amino-4-deoxy-L-arabinose transferase-like glycosyltransferase
MSDTGAEEDMKSTTESLIARLAMMALTLTAGAFAVSVLALAAYRVPYPFELEWMESGSLQQVRRILAGEKLYVPPTLDFIPFIYPPLYFYTSAVVAKVVGAGFVPLRLVSLAASVGSAALIGWIVRREAGDWRAGILAGCLFLATYRFNGSWFDIARVDTLFLFLFLAALALTRFSATWRGALGAGCVFAAAYLTKQLALAMALPVLVVAAWQDWRKGIWIAASAATLAFGATWALDAWHGGWYRFYVFETLTAHSLEPKMWVGFWTQDLARPLLIACLAALSVVAMELRSGDRRRMAFYLAAGAAMVGGSYVSRLNVGGFANVLLWAYAWVAIMAGLGFAAASRWILTQPPERRGRLVLVLAVLGLLQFRLLAYRPLDHIPTAADAAAGQALVQRVAQIPGAVWVPYHPVIATMAGKPEQAHGMALIELLLGHGPVANGVRQHAAQAFRDHYFSAIILDGGWFPPELETIIEHRYHRHGSVMECPGTFVPVTGMRTRPERLFLK